MFRKVWLSLMLMGAAVMATAQTTRVRGQVRDAESGEPLPFVSVYFDDTTIGISTDLEGRYSLETRSGIVHTLTASLLGYENQSQSIHAGSFSEINFSLKPDPRQLEAALVRPDDRYIRSILRKLSDSLPLNDPDNAPDWHSRLYSRIEFDVTNMEDLLKLGILERNIGFVRQYSDTSAITGKAYIPAMISENLSDVYHQEGAPVNREVMRASHISGLEDDNAVRQFTGSYLLKTNFYKPSIGVFNLEIPNPAVASSRIFYNYFLVDSLQVEGRKTYVLRFHPKKLVTSPTFDGEMHIDAEDFGIRSVHASLSEASNVNWIRHINVNVENRRLPNGRWFYGEERLFIDFSITVSDQSRVLSFLANRQLSYGPPDYYPVMDPLLDQDPNVVVMKDVVPGDMEFWAQVRPFPLSEREQGIYDMVEDIQSRTFYKWTYGIARTLIANYFEVKPWGMEFGRWARTFVYNDIEGFRMQLGGRTTKYMFPKWRLGGYVAYGFKDKKIKGEIQSEWMIRRDKSRKLTVKFKHDFEQLGSGSGVFTAQNMFSSVFAQSHANMQSMVRTIDLLYEHEFTPSINTEFRWTSRRFWENAALPFQLQDGTHWDSFAIHQLHTQVRFSWDERVNRNFYVKTYMFSQYPVLLLSFDYGIKGITRNDIGFFRSTATLQWKVPSTAIGFGRLSLEGGLILGSVPYPLLKLHEGNQTYFMDRTAFSLMNYYEFASDRWLSGYYEHNFNGFFLGKIPLIKKLDLREVATVRFAWGTISPENQGDQALFQLPNITKTLEKPYVEVGVGISNILRILRVDAFWRLTHRRPEGPNFTVNVGVDVDF